MGLLNNLLQHPLTRGMELDDPRTTLLRKKIIRQKPFLRKIYEEWYSIIYQSLPAINGPILELGSGAGFLKEYIPDLISSDIIAISGNDIVCDALNLPFSQNSLRAIVLLNVLHHIMKPDIFFLETQKCLKKNGVMILIEPWVSAWSKVIYNKLHHEPFAPDSPSWTLPESGPLSGGNDALPWIIFQRDRDIFEKKTGWYAATIQPIMPFRYLLSGGISMRNIMPSWLFRPITYIENNIPDPLMDNMAMFAIIVLKRKG